MIKTDNSVMVMVMIRIMVSTIPNFDNLKSVSIKLLYIILALYHSVCGKHEPKRFPKDSYNTSYKRYKILTRFSSPKNLLNHD